MYGGGLEDRHTSGSIAFTDLKPFLLRKEVNYLRLTGRIAQYSTSM